LPYLKLVGLILTTLKLSKKPSETPVAKKAPVRRADPAKRDRSKPFVKAERPAEAPPARQRNHRYDGTLHDAQKHGHEAQKPDSRAPATQDARDRPILRSEYKGRKFVDDKSASNGRKQDDSKQNSGRPATRMDIDSQGRVKNETTRNYADREGAYRNPPRRGGKARDGFVASEFDKNRSNKEKFANRPVANNAELPRLSKRMAELGLCSRREADEWITNGWVKVDGVIIDTLGTRIKPDAEIVISGYAKEHQAENVTIILHKPVGYVSGQAEDGYQPAIVLVHPDNQWPDDPELHQHNPKQFHRGMLKNLAPAGRLDIDSTGMLVLTQDGRIARHLIGEDSSVEKEYLVRVEGELTDANLKKLNHGLTLDGVALKPAKVSWQNEDQLRFVLREGKKRQIRRMCEMVGLHVIGLKRIRIGSVTLGKLPVGQWRYLRANEQF